MSGSETLRHAADLISGDRQGAYGNAREDFAETAQIWTVVLRRRGLLAQGAEIDAHAVALCMVGLKLSREAYKPKDDNRTDGAGYFALAGDVLQGGTK